jgi:hypothetical protein
MSAFYLLNADSKPLTIDLKNPLYSKGVLSTKEGGIIEADDFRLQAEKLEYENRENDHHFIAEGSVLFNNKDFSFIAEKIYIDVETGEGVLYNAKTAIAPWFFSAKEIVILPNQSLSFIDASLTTVEGGDPKWSMHMGKAELSIDQVLSAENISLKLFQRSVMHFKRVKFPLDAIYNSPIRYSLRWDGQEGGYLGVRYALFDWQGLQTLLRVDWCLKRGLGGGLECDYISPTQNQEFHSINYVANDISVADPHISPRYRFSGNYFHNIERFKMTAHLSYDKVSDQEMPTDYYDHGLLLDHTKPTRLFLRKESKDWIINSLTRVKINDFETVKEQLPTVEILLRPYLVGNTPLVGTTQAKASYLKLEYSDGQAFEKNYNAPRLSLWQKFSLPLVRTSFMSTLKASGAVVFYGNNHNEKERFANVAIAEWINTMDLYKDYGPLKHTITPYCKLAHMTYPTTSPKEHYIFDIEDGLYLLDELKLGFEQALVRPELSGTFMRVLHVDMYLHSLFNTNNTFNSIHRLYGECNLYPSRQSKISIDTAWHLTENVLDHFNVDTGWTLSDSFALQFQYRYRSRYDWRKSDHLNYILDSYHSIDSLEASALSDQRHTVLFHSYLRLPSEIACHFQLRHGFGRHFKDKAEPPYTEFQIDLFATIQSALNTRLSYRHREVDDQISCHISVGKMPFSLEKNHCQPWIVEY